VFELFLQATSKNGVPLEVIRSRLPEINAEIASVLQGVLGFTVELESDEGSNEMAIYINYGDSKRIIECCSGMEPKVATTRKGKTHPTRLYTQAKIYFLCGSGCTSAQSGDICHPAKKQTLHQDSVCFIV
jgi:hypothetical protein